MLSQRSKLWIWLVFGIPALVRGVTQWGQVPRPVRAYVSLTAGLVMITLFLAGLWTSRKSQIQ